MTTESLQKLEQQVQALIAYCAELRQENTKLRERNRTVSTKLQKLLAQFKSLEDNDG